MCQRQTAIDLNTLWDYQQPAQSEARFHELLAQLPAENCLYDEVLTQIARALGLQQKFAEAHAILDQVQQRLALAADPPDHGRARLRYWLERGRVFNSSGAVDQARPCFLQAWQQATQAGDDELAIDAAHMLGIIEPSEEQLAWNLKALALAEQATTPGARRWLGSLYNNIGWSYHAQGQYDVALAYFEKAVIRRAAAGQARELRIARWCVARVLRDLGRVEEAWRQQTELAAELAAMQDADGYVFEELGECLLALGRPREAAPYFAQAYENLRQDPWLVANEAERLARLQALSQQA